jgi:hypothetical protein
MLARIGRAVRVRLNGEGSKSASSPVRAGKFKKQRRALREYVWLVCTCCLSVDYHI